jgi:MarR family transcriptional regulator, 2-MHQ and catechol-resistance regulon repressor
MARSKQLLRMIEDERISAFGMLVEANARLTRTFSEHLEDQVGIPLVYFEVLLRIERSADQQLAMGDLATQISITTGGVTRLVDRMEKVGLVERRPCPTDRRVNFLGVTSEGIAKLEAALTVHLDDLESEFASRLSEKELGNLVSVLNKLR